MLDQFHSDCLQLDAINVFSRIVKARSAMAGAQRASFDFNGFYFISGNKDIGFSIDKYCLRLNVWQNVKEVAINLRYFGLVASGGKKIIIIGGQKNGTETVNTVIISLKEVPNICRYLLLALHEFISIIFRSSASIWILVSKLNSHLYYRADWASQLR